MKLAAAFLYWHLAMVARALNGAAPEHLLFRTGDKVQLPLRYMQTILCMQATLAQRSIPVAAAVHLD